MHVLHMPPMDIHKGGRTISVVRDQHSSLWTAIELSSQDRGLFNAGDLSIVKDHSWILHPMWYKTPRQCIEVAFGRELSDVSMSRTNWHIVAYWDTLYLQAMSDHDISVRFSDLVGLSLLLTTDNKLAPSTVSPNNSVDSHISFSPVWAKLSDVFEECRRRYGDHYPKGHRHARSSMAMPLPLDSAGMVLARRMVDKLSQSDDTIVKFGDSRYLRCFYAEGAMRLSAASTYKNMDGDLARRDNEMALELTETDGRKRMVRCNDYWTWCATGRPQSTKVATRLIGDFRADCCVVIPQGRRFLNDLATSCRLVIPGAQVTVAPVRYIDPMFDEVVPEALPTTKHFRYMYQHEVRLVCVPGNSGISEHSKYVNVKMGPLKKYGADYIH